MRRTLVFVVAAALCSPAAIHAADAYPARPVRIVVPFATGGSLDVLVRLLSLRMAEQWKQQIVVDNRAGAGGNIGAELVAKATPDGHTLLAHSPGFAVNPSLQKLPFHPLRDFAPISLVGSSPSVLLVTPALPVHTVQELLAYARSRPGQLSYASTGNATAGHLNMELFKLLTGIDVLHVPFRVISQAQTELISGRVALWITTVPGALPHIQAGRMRALALGAERRAEALPQVPTMLEAGIKYEASTWYGLYAPAGTPRTVTAAINGELRRVLALPDIRERLTAMGIDPVGSTAEHLARHLREEITRWEGVIRKTGMKAE